jgi:hypothetical protein
MKRVRKLLPISLRRLIIQHRTRVKDLYFVVGTKAVMVRNRHTGEYLGNVYYNGTEFYFSRQLINFAGNLGYPSYLNFRKLVLRLLEECLVLGGF